jgi:outer membrane receptor protein involved in Fe transport
MRKVLAVFAVALLFGGLAAAQETTGDIRGFISSADGATLPGVTVTVDNVSTGLSRTVITDSQGEFKIIALPPGKYSLTASLDGFQTYKRNVDVDLGRTTRNDFVMELGAVTDIIEVTGEAPLVDVTSTVTGLTVNTDDLNARVPVGREATQVVLLAPSTTYGDRSFDSGYTPGQRLASISGASVAENSYQVNGLNITNFRNGLGSTQVPFEFIEELQIKSGGYEAEYGRSTGGVINMVTKSGTNQFRGAVSAYFEPESLQEQEPDTYERPNQDEERESLEANASIGGPIWRDKLFFFAFVRYTDDDTLGLLNTRGTRNELSEPYWGGKLDWNITPSHRLEGTYISDEVTVDVTTYDYDLDTRTLGGVAGVGTDERGGDNYIAKYTGIFTDNFLLSAQYGANDFNRTSQSAGDAFPYSYDGRGGTLVPLGSWVNWSRGSAFDEREAYRVDADLYIGNHSLRGGIDVEENFSFDNTEYSGGIYYRYYDDDRSTTGESVRVRHYATGGGFDVESNAAYVQDSWALTPNLTVNLGVRYEEFINKNGLGQSFIEVKDQWAPRVGAIWDPSGNGRSKIFGSYGLYYLPIASNTNVRMAGNEIFDENYYEFLGGINPDGSPVGYVDCGFGNICGNQGSLGDVIQARIISDGEVPDPRETISSNFDPMSQNELILGYEQMVSDNWSVGIRGVWREFNEIIEDYTIDEGLTNATGNTCWLEGTCAHEYRLGNPGTDFEGYYTDPDTGELLPISLSAAELGYPEGTRDYYAVELTFKRRFADNWTVQGSYTWSHLYGNYEGYVNSEIGQDDAGITQSFDFAGLMDHSSGDLPQDRRHNLKVFGAYAWDFGLQIGANLFYNSGRPVNSLGVHPTDDFAAAYGAFSFYTDGVPKPRGCCGTTDDIYGLDTMFKYDFGVGGVDMNVRLDIFNLFDTSQVTEVNEFGEQDSGDLNPSYGFARFYQRPRTVRFGVGLTF